MTPARLSLAPVIALLCSLLVAGCDPRPAETGTPALLEVIAADGTSEGYLFGTIHALPANVEWESPAIGAAIAQSELLLMEIADPGQSGAVFARLARTPGQPPVAERIGPEYRDDLARLREEHDFPDAMFGDIESWAAAVMIANGVSEGSRANGIERQLLARFAGRPVGEVEGAETQLSLFDRLPERAQQRLLEEVIEDAANSSRDPSRLRRAWLAGDLAAIEAEGNRSFLGDQALREVLLDSRNRAWIPAIEERFAAHGPVFIAVGGAHMVGETGLPALLEAEGYTVRRIQ